MLDLSSVNPQWTVAAPLPMARNRLGAAVLNGMIYAVGGQTGFDNNAVCLNNVCVWNPQNPTTWTAAASLPVAQSHVGATTILWDGFIVVIGGDSRVGRFLANVSAYNAATGVWSSLTPLPQARFAGVAGAIGDQMILTTGYNGGMTTTTWMSHPVPPPAK